jgi:hypothetical protein
MAEVVSLPSSSMTSPPSLLYTGPISGNTSIVESPACYTRPTIGTEMNPACPTELHKAYFSPGNIAYIQSMLKKGVYEQSGRSIPNQNHATVLVRMRSVYFTHAKQLPSYIRPISLQVDDLNRIVLDEAIPNILGSIEERVQYDMRQKVLPMAPPLPEYMSKAGLRSNQETYPLYR